jgi:hypothetical protein
VNRTRSNGKVLGSCLLVVWKLIVGDRQETVYSMVSNHSHRFGYCITTDFE